MTVVINLFRDRIFSDCVVYCVAALLLLVFKEIVADVDLNQTNFFLNGFNEADHAQQFRNYSKINNLHVSCPFHFNCDNGNCVLPRLVCDGNDDCGDNSDERDLNGNCPPCPPLHWTCANGRCIFDLSVCDGSNDCGDMSDEHEQCPPCPDTMFQCENRLCVSKSKICNGVDDCGDLTDEREEACPCSERDVRCPTEPGVIPPGSCIPLEWVCDQDGIWDCNDGWDQLNCTDNK